MAIIPLLRLIIFSLITLFSLGVLGLCAYFASLLVGGVSAYTAFIPLGLVAACLSIISLPLFWFLGTRPTRPFTSMILFEIIWFFLLWLLWVGTAGSAVAETEFACTASVDGYTSPDITNNPICQEIMAVEAFAFLNFFCAFIYYDVIFLYAIVNAIRGRSVWTTSVKEAADGTAPAVVVPMSQPPYPATAQYGAYPPNQPYNAYPQQVPPAQPYNPYPQQVPPQGTLDAQYGAYPPQVSPQVMQNQPYNYPAAPGTPQQQPTYASYDTSPTGNNTTLPPQPNYSAHPMHGSQAPLPLPSGYQV